MSRDRLADAVVRLDAVRVADSSGAVGSQRARCSRAVVEALRAPLGAPVRVTLRESDGEDISYLCAIEPWDERRGMVVEIDAFAREGTAAESSNRRDDALDGPRVGTIETLDAKPIACDRVRLIGVDACENDRSAVEKALRERLVRVGATVSLGRRDDGAGRSRPVSFVVDRVEPRVRGNENVTWRVTPSTVIEHETRAEEGDAARAARERARPAESRVAASEEAIQALRQAIVWPMRYGREAKALGVSFPRGLLLHGPPGTGKTEAVRAVADEAGVETLAVSSGDIVGAYAGESEKRLRKVFERGGRNVKRGKPCVIVIDELDVLCPTRQGGTAHENRIVAQLLTLMDGAGESNDVAVPVVATTSRPNAIDPALRRPGRFDREVEMSLPNAGQRADILKLHAATLPLDDDVDFAAVSENSKGYSGADIAALCREAAMCAIKRRTSDGGDGGGGGDQEMKVSAADFQTARSRIRASVVRGLAVELPPVAWDDIGGLDDVKKRLRQAVEWPLHHADAFRRLGLRPPKGILLHGPPGCAKTTLARAAATASGATIITLTAADVFSKYLGEGEKILRSTFSKARKSAPAVLLLDEIDGMCGSRGDGASEGAHDVATRLLSVFLTEMDGLESTPTAGGGVLVVATTNRPKSLDPALTRPGRLDLVLEIPPLDHAGRLAALRVHTRDVHLHDDVDLDDLARRAVGYTGAELRRVVDEAAFAALRRDVTADRVRLEHFTIDPKYP